MKILIFRTVAHQMSIGSYNSQEIGMAKAFVQMRHDCDVIYFTWKQNRDVDLLELDNHKARLLWRRGIPLIRTGIYPKMASKKFLNNYDLIITNEYNQLMSLIVCKNHTFGKTFVYNGPYYNMFKISFMEKVYDSLFKKSFRENCDWFLAKSVLSERYLNDRGIVNIDTVGVALDVTKFDDKIELSSETLALIDYLKDNECLLYVGSLSERKNFPFLLEMFNELCQINDEIKLVVVGSGDKKFVNKCISNIDKNSEERIKCGNFNNENEKKYNIGLILWDNGIFDNTNSPENVFGFLNKKNLNWENEEIINEYILTENNKINNTINQYEIISNDSLITMPYEFRDWYGYFDLGIGILSTFNSYNKLILEQGEISYVTEYKSLRLMINDEYLLLTQDEVVGAEVYEKYGTIIIGFNDNLIELNFTIDHLKKIKENGVHLVGHGFSLKKIIVYGPRLINADPMILIADNKNQIIKLNFNEDARVFIGNVFLEDENGNFIEGMKCNLDENEYNIIVCNGSFNKIGYYKIVDNNGVTLTNKYLEVVQ